MKNTTILAAEIGALTYICSVLPLLVLSIIIANFSAPIVHADIQNSNKSNFFNVSNKGDGLEKYFENMNDAMRNNVPYYWTYGNRSQSFSEAQVMTEMVRIEKNVLIAGKGKEAELLYSRCREIADRHKVLGFSKKRNPKNIKFQWLKKTNT